MTSATKKNARRGARLSKAAIASLEFLFAAPAFFVLAFFVVEIALTWSDRHIMRLAAYRAARAVVKTRAAQEYSGPLCWTDPESGAREDKANLVVRTAARRASAKIMATVTPSVQQLLTMFGAPRAASHLMEDMLATSVGHDFADGASAVLSNPYVHAIARMMEGLPAAWLLTKVTCENITFPAAGNAHSTAGVEVTLTYNRAGKMPYTATILWLLHKFRKFDPDYDGTRGLLYVDPLTFGIRTHADLTSSNGQALLQTVYDRTRQIIVESAEEFAQSGATVRARSELPGSLVDPATPEVFGEVAGLGFDAMMAGSATWRTQQLSEAQGLVNAIAEAAANLLVTAPDPLKTIPIRVSVRIPNYSDAYVNQGSPWDNTARAIGSFTDGSKISQVARWLSEAINKDDPPSGRGLPYVEAP